MSLSDDDFALHLQEMLVVDALNLGPEQHTAVCTTLTALRWIKGLCRIENKTIEEVSAELVIKKLTGIDVQPEIYASSLEKLSKQMLGRKPQATRHKKHGD